MEVEVELKGGAVAVRFWLVNSKMEQHRYMCQSYRIANGVRRIVKNKYPISLVNLFH